MTKHEPHANLAISLLFLGLSLFEALRTHTWGMAVLWATFAILFLIADRREHRAPVRR